MHGNILVFGRLELKCAKSVQKSDIKLINREMDL